MHWLFDRLRPKVDETSLYDDENDHEANRPAPVARWKPTLVAVVLIALGLGLIAGAVVIGVRVDGVLFETISTRRSEIWAWVPMLLMSLGGVGLVVFAVRLLRGIADSYSTRRERR